MKITRKTQGPPTVTLRVLDPGDVFYVVGEGGNLYIKTDEEYDRYIKAVLLCEGMVKGYVSSKQVVKVDCELLCKY